MGNELACGQLNEVTVSFALSLSDTVTQRSGNPHFVRQHLHSRIRNTGSVATFSSGHFLVVSFRQQAKNNTVQGQQRGRMTFLYISCAFGWKVGKEELVEMRYVVKLHG
ncbi:uncharacterized protein LOC119461136 [Dermacentor silvarum]|uniref:uncharacterized protein LOC119461136 n=1 Tax=Dermacentor silvarum TaxID=543639 RepID=UPI0021015633|nr:uncharacterized protein LOC119461136 [Dermacentor silvarum]